MPQGEVGCGPQHDIAAFMSSGAAMRRHLHPVRAGAMRAPARGANGLRRTAHRPGDLTGGAVQVRISTESLPQAKSAGRPWAGCFGRETGVPLRRVGCGPQHDIERGVAVPADRGRDASAGRRACRRGKSGVGLSITFNVGRGGGRDASAGRRAYTGVESGVGFSITIRGDSGRPGTGNASAGGEAGGTFRLPGA